MDREGVTVCITAYKSKDYIKECLDSVVKQTWFENNDNFEIIVGIDGCQERLEYIKTIMNNYKNRLVVLLCFLSEKFVRILMSSSERKSPFCAIGSPKRGEPFGVRHVLSCGTCLTEARLAMFRISKDPVSHPG